MTAELTALAEALQRVLARPAPGTWRHQSAAAFIAEHVAPLLTEREADRRRWIGEAQFHAEIIERLLEELGPDAFDECDCDGEEGTQHLIWHLVQQRDQARAERAASAEPLRHLIATAEMEGGTPSAGAVELAKRVLTGEITGDEAAGEYVTITALAGEVLETPRVHRLTDE